MEGPVWPPSYDSLNTPQAPSQKAHNLRRQTSPLIRNMARLPVELVHDILSDCTLYKMLVLVSGKNDYLRKCVLSCPGCQELFYSEEALDRVVEYFRTYHGMCVLLQMQPNPTSPLSLNVKDKRLDVEHIKTYLHSTIFSILEGAASHLNVLRHEELDGSLPLIWDSSSARALSERFISLQCAQKYLNESKARQLHNLAWFKEKYPELLRTSTDPPAFAKNYDDKKLKNVKAPRLPTSHPKTNHIVRRFRRDARKVARSQFITNKFFVKHLFRYHVMPLVPYDWCLRFFCHFLDDRPLVGDEMDLPDLDGSIVNGTGLWRECRYMFFESDQSWLESFHKRARVYIFRDLEGFAGVEPADTDETLPSGKPPSERVWPPDETILSSVQFRYPYPAAVAKDIRIALDGLKTVYTTPDPNTDIRPIVPRTEHTRWSLDVPAEEPMERRSQREQTRGVFSRPKVQSKTDQEHPGRIQPYDESEFEWLGAFCRAVEYMGGLLASEKADRK